jgi:hypothetical protein
MKKPPSVAQAHGSKLGLSRAPASCARYCSRTSGCHGRPRRPRAAGAASVRVVHPPLAAPPGRWLRLADEGCLIGSTAAARAAVDCASAGAVHPLAHPPNPRDSSPLPQPLFGRFTRRSSTNWCGSAVVDDMHSSVVAKAYVLAPFGFGHDDDGDVAAAAGCYSLRLRVASVRACVWCSQRPAAQPCAIELETRSAETMVPGDRMCSPGCQLPVCAGARPRVVACGELQPREVRALRGARPRRLGPLFCR